MARRYPAVPEYYAENRLLILNWNRYEADPVLVYTSWNRKTGFSCKAEASGGKEGFRKGFNGRGGRKPYGRRFQYLEEVPVGVDFRENSRLGVVGEEKQLHDGVLQIFWQQVLHHSPEEMRMACFFDSSIPWQMSVYHSMKWVPHIWSESGEVRFLAGNKEAAAEILPDLTRELSAQKEQVSFLIFLFDPMLILGESSAKPFTGGKGGPGYGSWNCRERTGAS